MLLPRQLLLALLCIALPALPVPLAYGQEEATTEAEEDDADPEIPEELLEDEHLREEMGVNEFTTPSIRKIFDDLKKLRPLPYDELKRPLPNQPPQDRPRLSLLMGVLLGDGFFAVEAEQFFDLEPIGRALLNHGKVLGSGTRISSHMKSVLEKGASGQWNELKEELVRAQKDVLGSTPAAIIAAAPDLSALRGSFDLRAAPEADGLQWVEALPKQRDVEGHLRVRGASTIQRYFGETEPAVDRDGWFATGDLARIDRDGNLAITGRAKDLIKSGGEWINPAEIEDIVGEFSDVSLAAVIGRGHPKWGERPVLLVEMREGSAMSDAALIEALRDRVVSWWVPDSVIRVDRMPLAATGKIDRMRLRAEFGGASGDPGA